MKRLLTGFALASLAAAATADPVYDPPGPNLTYGQVSNGQTIVSHLGNPAAGAGTLKKEASRFGFGVLTSAGFGYEVGPIDDLMNDLDALSNTLSQTYMTVPQATAALAQANAVVAKLNDGSMARVFATAHVPLFPMVYSRSGFGSLVLDANMGAFANMLALGSPVTLTGVVPTITVDSETSLFVHGATVGELSLGYSRPLVSTEDGGLYGGVRGKYYNVKLSRSLVRVSTAQGDTGNVLQDEFDKNAKQQSGFGLDLGVLWMAKHYRLGATVANVNAPSFKYGAVNTTGYTDTNLISRAQQTDEYELKTQLSTEAALFTESRNWVVNLSADANAVPDPAGSEYQWATVSAAYATDSWWIPGLRVGYRSNLAGTKMSYATGGLTLFKSLNLDVAYGLKDINIDGDKAPRSVMVNLGLELMF